MKKLFKVILFQSLLLSLMVFNTISAQDAEINTSVRYDEIYDPFEPVNRAIFSFNNVADRIVLEPIAKGYKKLPSPLQSGINNF